MVAEDLSDLTDNNVEIDDDNLEDISSILMNIVNVNDSSVNVSVNLQFIINHISQIKLKGRVMSPQLTLICPCLGKMIKGCGNPLINRSEKKTYHHCDVCTYFGMCRKKRAIFILRF